jgi:hypothetical protein
MADIPPSPSFESNVIHFLEPRNRLVNKKGRVKAIAKNVLGKTKLYLADIFTTTIDMKWYWVILLFCVSYIFSWLFFGTVWWFIVLARGEGVCITEVCMTIKSNIYNSMTMKLKLRSVFNLFCHPLDKLTWLIF